jgi:hypothetical protein
MLHGVALTNVAQHRTDEVDGMLHMDWLHGWRFLRRSWLLIDIPFICGDFWWRDLGEGCYGATSRRGAYGVTLRRSACDVDSSMARALRLGERIV